MARIWQAGPRHAARQATRSSSSDADEQSSQKANDSPANIVDFTKGASLSESPLFTLEPRDRETLSPAPMEQALSSLKIADKSQHIPTPTPILLTIDQLEEIWGHIHKPTDLANQAEWSHPIHWKEKMAYVFWRFASQDSINELLGSFSKENLTRPRREVKMVMNRLLAYDCVYDSESESGDEGEEDDGDGEDWDEVDLGEIEGEEEEESVVGVSDADRAVDGEDAETNLQGGTMSDDSELGSLLTEALDAMQEMVDEDKQMMDIDTVESMDTSVSIESREAKPPESLPRESTSSTGDSEPRVPSEELQEDLTNNTNPKVDKPQPDKLTKHPKHKLPSEAPQSSKPAKKSRPSLDPAKLAKELTETWRGVQAPVGPEVKETRIAVRILGQRGTKSIKYKVQWAEAGDCSFADSWVDKEDAVVTKEMIRVWEGSKTKKVRSKSKVRK